MNEDFPLDLPALQRVLDYLNVGVYITDRERRIRLWNRKAEEITGHPASDVLGLACHENVLCHTDAQGKQLCTTDLCPLYRAMQAGIESDDPVIVYARDTDGDLLALEASVGPLRDDEGNVVGGIEAFQNVTSRMRDMELARQVQRSLLPARMPDVDGYAVQALYSPHSLVGGDIYDVQELDGGQMALLIADMQGHGVSAALATMWLRSICDDLADAATQPQTFVRAINARMSGGEPGTRFATCCYAVLDTRTGRVDYTVAGHPVPLLYNARSGEVTRALAHGMPVGIDEEEPFGQDSLEMEPGDTLLFYTDGAIDVFDVDGIQLGIDGLAGILGQIGTSPAGLVDELYRRILTCSGTIRLADDLTLVALHRSALDRSHP